MFSKNRFLSLCALCVMAASQPAGAVLVDWTDWTAISSTSATGSMGGISVTVSSSVAMNGVSQTACGTNYWIEPVPSDPAYTGGTVDNGPTACEQVGLNSANTVTATFSSAVDNLYMALLSVGQPGLQVTYDFDQAFVIDSEGSGYWGNDSTDGVIGAGDTLAMREFHGVLRFTAPVTSLTFSSAPSEFWHAFTFGSGPALAVPVPGSLMLMGIGLVGLGLSRRRRTA